MGQPQQVIRIRDGIAKSTSQSSLTFAGGLSVPVTVTSGNRTSNQVLLAVNQPKELIDEIIDCTLSRHRSQCLGTVQQMLFWRSGDGMSHDRHN
jgi:hypothetical protein